MTCSIQCSAGKCDRRMSTPTRYPAPEPGLAGNRRRLICKAFGTTGAVNIVLNWHDMNHVGLHFHLETLR